MRFLLVAKPFVFFYFLFSPVKHRNIYAHLNIQIYLFILRVISFPTCIYKAHAVSAHFIYAYTI